MRVGFSAHLVTQFSFVIQKHRIIHLLTEVRDAGINILSMVLTSHGSKKYDALIVLGRAGEGVIREWNERFEGMLSRDGLSYDQVVVSHILYPVAGVPGVYRDLLEVFRRQHIPVLNFYSTEQDGVIVENADPFAANKYINDMLS